MKRAPDRSPTPVKLLQTANCKLQTADCRLWLELEARSNLQLPRRVARAVRIQNQERRGVARVAGRIREVRVVRDVEDVGEHFDAASLTRREAVAEAHVGVEEAGTVSTVALRFVTVDRIQHRAYRCARALVVAGGERF